MGDCSYCNKNEVLTRKCNHCGRETCTKHILPEKHDCPDLDFIGEDTKHLQSDIDAKLDNDAQSKHSPTTTSQGTTTKSPSEQSENTGLRADIQSKRDTVADLLSSSKDDEDGTTYTCNDCGSEYEYYIDADHCCSSSPEPIENAPTYGGSGRDYANADFPTSPDVNPDGSLVDSDVESTEEGYPDERNGSHTWSKLKEYVWAWVSVAAVLLLLQYGFGIDVFSLLKDYFLP